jgi:hypothetical protein
MTKSNKPQIEVYTYNQPGFGLYSSLEGKGTTYRYAIGPRNLLEAIEDRTELDRSARAATGVGRAHLTIAGRQVDPFDLYGVETMADARELISRYTRARVVIFSCRGQFRPIR